MSQFNTPRRKPLVCRLAHWTANILMRLALALGALGEALADLAVYCACWASTRGPRC